MRKIVVAIILAIPLLGWAQVKQELNLQQAISMALEKNYGIVIDKKNVETAAMQNNWGNAGALPTLSFSGSGSDTWNNYFDDDDDLLTKSLSATVSLDFTLFDGFSARIQKSMLEEMEKLYQGNLTITVENTIADVIMAYQNVLKQTENVKLVKQIMDLSNDRYQQEQFKVELGTAVTYDLLQAKNAYLNDKSSYLSAVATYNNAVRQLNFTMAVDLEAKYEFTQIFEPENAEFNMETLQQKLFSNNAQMKNQYINLERSKLEVRAAKSAFYPTLSIGASTGVSNIDNEYETYSNPTSSFNNSISAGVSYNIYEGGKRKVALQTSKIALEITDVETDEMKHELKNQLAQELELYNVRKELVDIANENLKAAQLNLDLSKQKLDNGTINSFNYRDVQELYLSSALDYQRSIYNVNESYYTLLRLTGGIVEVFQ